MKNLDLRPSGQNGSRGQGEIARHLKDSISNAKPGRQGEEESAIACGILFLLVIVEIVGSASDASPDVSFLIGLPILIACSIPVLTVCMAWMALRRGLRGSVMRAGKNKPAITA
jgi:hypothetical protein